MEQRLVCGVLTVCDSYYYDTNLQFCDIDSGNMQEVCDLLKNSNSHSSLCVYRMMRSPCLQIKGIVAEGNTAPTYNGKVIWHVALLQSILRLTNDVYKIQ